MSLYQIINKFSIFIYLKYKVQITNNLTISSLALDIFLSTYNKNNSNTPLINKKSIFNDIKCNYYGGITEVYRPTNIDNEILYYYDVNSLYPYAALNPIPDLQYRFINNISQDGRNYLINKNKFGFFYCYIETNNTYLGLLPVRNQTGIILPNGHWRGWYFSE